MSNIDKNAAPLVLELKQLIEKSRQQIAISINSEITILYWNIGKHIFQFTNERAEYGKEILPTLSAKLVIEFGKGFSTRNLANMLKIYEFYPDENILQTLSAKLRKIRIEHKKNLIYIISCNLNSYRLHLRLTLFTLFLIRINGILLGRIITYYLVNKVNKVELHFLHPAIKVEKRGK